MLRVVSDPWLLLLNWALGCWGYPVLRWRRWGGCRGGQWIVSWRGQRSEQYHDRREERTVGQTAKQTAKRTGACVAERAVGRIVLAEAVGWFGTPAGHPTRKGLGCRRRPSVRLLVDRFEVAALHPGGAAMGVGIATAVKAAAAAGWGIAAAIGTAAGAVVGTVAGATPGVGAVAGVGAGLGIAATAGEGWG